MTRNTTGEGAATKISHTYSPWTKRRRKPSRPSIMFVNGGQENRASKAAPTKLGDEFTYRYKDIHYSKQKVTEFIPGKKVVWLVLDSSLSFIEDKSEWNGTQIIFDIASKGGKTEVRFSHVGLVPEVECYDGCSNAWGSYINGSLKKLIAKGKGQPNPAK